MAAEISDFEHYAIFILNYYETNPSYVLRDILQYLQAMLSAYQKQDKGIEEAVTQIRVMVDLGYLYTNAMSSSSSYSQLFIIFMNNIKIPVQQYIDNNVDCMHFRNAFRLVFIVAEATLFSLNFTDGVSVLKSYCREQSLLELQGSIL